MTDRPRSGRLVYSSDSGRVCPRCGEPHERRECGDAGSLPIGDGNVRVSRETKGRKGKCVTVIRGLPLTPANLGELAKELKRRCGSGGTVKDGAIEIQGDHRDAVVEALAKRRFAVKRAGG